MFWLGQQRSPENAQYLRGLFDKLAGRRRGAPTNPSGRRSSSRSRRCAGRGTTQWLLQVATDPAHSVETRKQALFSAGQAGVSTAALSALYPRLNERQLKEQLIWVMSQKRDPAAATRLMEIAKSDPDRELRKKAIFWLGQSKGIRA